MSTRRARAPRGSLTRDRVVATAFDLADDAGLAALTIRALAARLDVTPMAIYTHVRDKEALLDALVDGVFARIELPVPGRPWREELTRRTRSAREVLARHSWALTLIDSRPRPGPATLRHHDAVIGTLREAGFSLDDVARAFAVLDSYLYGFVLIQTTMPARTPADVTAVAEGILAAMPPGEYPYSTEFALGHVLRPGYDFAEEFERGLTLVLDGLEA